MDDILTATGLGKGSVYGAFGDKHQLFVRVFDDHCAGVIVATRQALDGPDAGADGRLRAYVLAVVEDTVADVSLRGCLLAKGTAELAAHDTAIAGARTPDLRIPRGTDRFLHRRSAAGG